MNALSTPPRILLVGLSEALARSIEQFVASGARAVIASVLPSLSLASTMLSVSRADILIVDWQTRHLEGRALLARIRAAFPELRLIALVDDPEAHRDTLAEASDVIRAAMLGDTLAALVDAPPDAPA